MKHRLEGNQNWIGPISSELHLAVQALASPQRPQAVVDCAVKLVRMAAVADQVVSPNELPVTLDALSKLAATSNTGMLAQLVGLATAKRVPKYAHLLEAACKRLV